MTSNEEYKKRFDTHIKIDEDSGCHLWEAAKNNIGYGLSRFRKGMATTHRVIMDLLLNQYPEQCPRNCGLRQV